MRPIQGDGGYGGSLMRKRLVRRREGCDADLISLSEAIATSTAGGRMFFHLMGVFAQWEREEITERVNASVLKALAISDALPKRASGPHSNQTARCV